MQCLVLAHTSKPKDLDYWAHITSKMRKSPSLMMRNIIAPRYLSLIMQTMILLKRRYLRHTLVQARKTQKRNTNSLRMMIPHQLPMRLIIPIKALKLPSQSFSYPSLKSLKFQIRQLKIIVLCQELDHMIMRNHMTE